MTLGSFGQGLSRNRVIFPRNSRHYRESDVPFRESAVFYRAAGDQGPSNSQHYRGSGASWREVTCFLGPLAALPGAGRPGVAGGRPGLFRGPGEAPFH